MLPSHMLQNTFSQFTKISLFSHKFKLRSVLMETFRNMPNSITGPKDICKHNVSFSHASKHFFLNSQRNHHFPTNSNFVQCRWKHSEIYLKALLALKLFVNIMLASHMLQNTFFSIHKKNHRFPTNSNFVQC